MVTYLTAMGMKTFDAIFGHHVRDEGDHQFLHSDWTSDNNIYYDLNQTKLLHSSTQ